MNFNLVHVTKWYGCVAKFSSFVAASDKRVVVADKRTRHNFQKVLRMIKARALHDQANAHGYKRRGYTI